MSDEKEQGPAIPEAAARHLAMVDEQTAGGPGPAPGTAQGIEPERDWLEEARFFTGMGADFAEAALRPVIFPLEPERVLYGPDTREKVAVALAPVLKKYDGKIPEWLRQWMPEIKLAMVLSPIVAGTVRAVMAAKNQKTAEAAHAAA